MSKFGLRFKSAFGGAKNVEIATLLGVSESAVSNYVGGRVPDAEVLLHIRNLTNCNLDWLLTGEGEPSLTPRMPGIEETIERRMREIVREELRRDLMDEEDEMDARIEPADMILAPVVAHIGPGRKKESGRTIDDEEIGEIERRLRPRRKRTG